MHPDAVKMEPGTCPKCGMKLVPQDHLYAKLDLSKVGPEMLKAVISIKNLAGAEKEVIFTELVPGSKAVHEKEPSPESGQEPEQKR